MLNGQPSMYSPKLTVYFKYPKQNSDAHSHVNKRGNYKDYSPCHTYYPHRYAIGIHNAKHDDLTRFQSSSDYHNYVSMYDSFLKTGFLETLRLP